MVNQRRIRSTTTSGPPAGPAKARLTGSFPVGRPPCAIRVSWRPGLGRCPRAPGCGGRAPGARGEVSRLRPATPSPGRRERATECGSRRVIPTGAGPGRCAAYAVGPAGVRRPGARCGRARVPTSGWPLAAPHRVTAPGGGATPHRAPAPRGAAAPRGPATRLVLAYPHVPAPDVSGPRWPRPWERLLMPDQKARRQRT